MQTLNQHGVAFQKTIRLVFIGFSLMFFSLQCTYSMAQSGKWKPLSRKDLSADPLNQIMDILPKEHEPLTDANKLEVLPGIGQSEGEKSDNLSLLPCVYVRKFNLIGNKVFSDKELAKVTASYENREITSEELHVLRRALTQYYIKRGYVTSGAVIPDQKVMNGIITLHIMEGKLSEVKVEGNRYFHSHYIVDRLRIASGPPVNITNLQQALQCLQQDLRIKRLNAQLSPGFSLGESVLKVDVEEETPYVLEFGICNCQSPSIGSFRNEIHGMHQNLTGNGDIFEGILGSTKRSNDIDLSYALPVSKHDTILKIQYRQSDTLIVEEPFDSLDIKSEEKTYGISISHPFYRRLGQEFCLSLTAEFRHSETYLLGNPFSFYYGSDDGKTDLNVLRFKQQWTDRGLKRVFAARSCLSVGFDSIGSTLKNGAVDGKFFSWLGQMQLLRILGDTDYVITFRLDMQLSNDPLLPLEKFSIGGMNSVRGYRENRLVRDNGIFSSVEFQIPLILNNQGEIILQLIPFLDFGKSWNTDNHNPDLKSLASIGFGFELTITQYIHMQAYGGIPLRDIHTSDNDLQDEGFHFQFTGSFF